MKTCLTSRNTMAIAIIALIAVSVPVFAKGDKPKAHGKITAVSATSITVTPKDGTAQTFTINAATKVSVDKLPATAADLSVGQHGRVFSDDGTTATEIAVSTHKGKKGGAPAATPETPAPAAATPAP